jgi:tetratricopeptide (TPR) repeat protein
LSRNLSLEHTMKTRHIILSIAAGLVVINALLFGGLWLLRRGVGPASSQTTETTGQSHNREAAKAAAAEGYALKRSGQSAQAIAAFEAAIRKDSDYSDSYHGLAQAQREAGDPSAALIHHDRAIQLDPARFDLYWERGVTYLRLKNYEAAITDFEACLERNRRFGNAHLGLGKAYRSKRDFQAALMHHDKAIALKPDSDWFYRERGNTYQKMGDQQRADADFAKAGELQQNQR